MIILNDVPFVLSEDFIKYIRFYFNNNQVLRGIKFGPSFYNLCNNNFMSELTCILHVLCT